MLTSATTARRHETLYFPDGNIALLASYTHDRYIIFRVHQSVLVATSPVFRDMFSLPTGSSQEMYDGVPAVDMMDSGQDLECLLRVLYHQRLVLKIHSLSLSNLSACCRSNVWTR